MFQTLFSMDPIKSKEKEAYKVPGEESEKLFRPIIFSGCQCWALGPTIGHFRKNSIAGWQVSPIHQSQSRRSTFEVFSDGRR